MPRSSRVPKHARKISSIDGQTSALPTPYHYIKPNFIRGVTLEGKPLVAKSIIRSADGVYHVQLQVAPFPSEQARLLGRGGPYASSLSILPQHLGPSPSATGLRTDRNTKEYGVVADAAGMIGFGPNF